MGHGASPHGLRTRINTDKNLKSFFAPSIPIRVDPCTKSVFIRGLFLLFLAVPAWGHDGGFGHSRRTIHVTAAGNELRLEYRILPNRDEALVELVRMDADGDGKVSDEEKERYFSARGKQLAGALVVRTTTGEIVPVQFVRCELSHSLGQTYHFLLPTAGREVLLDDRV